MVVQVARLVAVLALLCVAAAVATPNGRLPLALRGVLAVLRKDGTDGTQGTRRTEVVPWRKRLLALVLVLLAALLAIV